MNRIGHITKIGVHRTKYKYSNNSGSIYHWTYVKRATDKKKRNKIANAMEDALDNKKYIGYSNKGDASCSLYDAVKPNFNIKNLKKKVKTNCCNLVSVCCRNAGFNTPRKSDSRTLADKWLGLKKIKYEKGMKLYRGDILVSTTMPKCHTAVYLGKDK